MEYIIGIPAAHLICRVGVYAVRGGNLMMGMLIMAIIWTVLPLIGSTFATNPNLLVLIRESRISVLLMQLQKFSSPVRKAGEMYFVNVVFGAWFGRVLLQTGIADALIRKAVELGGDKPVIICVLLSTVTTAIFFNIIWRRCRCSDWSDHSSNPYEPWYSGRHFPSDPS